MVQTREAGGVVSLIWGSRGDIPSSGHHHLHVMAVAAVCSEESQAEDKSRMAIRKGGGPCVLMG